MKKISQVVLGFLLPVLLFGISTVLIILTKSKETNKIIGLFILLSLLIIIFKKYKTFIYSYLTVSLLIISTIIYSEMKTNEYNRTRRNEKLIALSVIERKGFYEELNEIPQKWGQVHIGKTDTFKFISCLMNDAIEIFKHDSLNIFVYKSYYSGSDSLKIVKFNYSSLTEFDFDMISLTNNETVVWKLELIDTINIIGHWSTDKMKENIALKYQMANIEEKIFKEIQGPCDY
jgi:hypothetical protein